MQLQDRTVSILEYDKIRAMLASLAPTAGAKEQCLALLPAENESEVRYRLARTGAAKALLSDKGMPSFGAMPDVTDLLTRAGKGATLTARELLDVGNLLRTSRSLLDYIRVNRRFETVLDEVFERLLPDRKLEDRIYRSIVS